MAKPHGSVRIGPISLFTLVIILCLAVLAVLSVTTARAELSVTERQAATTTETYGLETAGQTFVAEVDGALAQRDDAALRAVLERYGVATAEQPAGAAAAGGAAAGEAISDESPTGETIADETPTGEAAAAAVTMACPGLPEEILSVGGTFADSLVSATFSLESGRTLAIELRINDNNTYTIEQWKTTTQWTDDGTGETLWLG